MTAPVDLDADLLIGSTGTVVQTPPLRAPIGAGDRPDVRPRAASRLGLRRPLPFGLALGPVLLLAVWIVGSAAGSSTRACCRRRGPSCAPPAT